MDKAIDLLDDWTSQLNELGQKRRPCFFLMDFEQRKPRVWALDSPASDLPHFSFPGRKSTSLPSQAGSPLLLTADPVPTATFRRAFEVVQQGLRRGDSFLTNLTFPTPVSLSGDLTAIYQRSEAKYRVLLPDVFVCFSPETFVTINQEGYIESRPMKGTAQNTPAARAALLTSQKEIAEHATIVDLIRNDLSQVAKRVRVTEYRYIHKIATSKRGLVQTSSKIGGWLPEGWRDRLGTTLARLLPAGSVSGAPKPATLDIIRRAEGRPRGYYCGIAGYFDGETLDTCVLIRYVEKTAQGGYLFRSGGGVTARSSWQDEYAELCAKISIPEVTNTFSLL